MQNNIGMFLAKRAMLSPEVEGYMDSETGARLSFREMNEGANRAAHMFLGLGVQPGDRVGLLMMNSIEFVESFFGLAKLGAVVVPLNWRLVPDELSFILKDSGVGIPKNINPAEADSSGFAIVQSITEKFGGKLSINTDRGSCVSLTILESLARED